MVCSTKVEINIYYIEIVNSRSGYEWLKCFYKGFLKKRPKKFLILKIDFRLFFNPKVELFIFLDEEDRELPWTPPPPPPPPLPPPPPPPPPPPLPPKKWINTNEYCLCSTLSILRLILKVWIMSHWYLLLSSVGRLSSLIFHQWPVSPEILI